ncbi:MAG: enoyl-CoA hydratase [Proteobacteria bacterium]|nr:MAG: enoyl-CoA hydratase [Pseudomonadota bacterium]
MSYQCFAIKIDSHIAHLQFSRPDQLNSMNKAFWLEFPRALREIDASGEARALVISSTGKHFCAGMDLEVFQKPDPNMFGGEPGRRGEYVRRLVLQLQDCFNTLEAIRIPVLSAIQGGCIGGAVDLVCATDSRYCTSDAFFTVKETALGITADLGTLQRLPNLIAPGLARELAYTSRKMKASEALNAGFVNQVFDDTEQMLEAVMDVARQIAVHSPLAVAGTKHMINYARDHSVAESLQYMATWQSGMFQPNDLMLSMAAQVQKKPGEFESLHPVRPPFET